MNLVILAIAILAGLVLLGLVTRRPSEGSPEDYDAVKDEVKYLRKRVSTLERILIDPDERLRRNFRGL